MSKIDTGVGDFVRSTKNRPNDTAKVVELRPRGWIKIEYADGEILNARDSELKTASAEQAASYGQPRHRDATDGADGGTFGSGVVHTPGIGTKKAARAARQAEKAAARQAILDAGGTLPTPKSGFFRPEIRARYQTVRADGKVNVDCGDQLAAELRTLTLPETYAKAAVALNTTEEALVEKYKHLNPGQQRMCLGNRLRALGRQAEKAAEAASISVAKTQEALPLETPGNEALAGAESNLESAGIPT